MQFRGGVHLSGVFLRNRSTNLNETWNITSTYIMQENCRKKYLKSCIEKKLQCDSIFHTNTSKLLSVLDKKNYSLY